MDQPAARSGFEAFDVDDATPMLAHEFGNSLSALALLADSITATWGSRTWDDQLTQVLRMQRMLARMALNVDSVLDAVRVSTGTFETGRGHVDLREVVLERLADFADEANGMTVDIPEGYMLRADPNHLWMILGNFLGNALKYGRPPLTIRAERAGLVVRVEVEDRGGGLDAAESRAVFERGVRGSNPGGVAGTGLGLWIARAVAEAYGGHVYFRTPEGAGAVFGVELPAVA